MFKKILLAFIASFAFISLSFAATPVSATDSNNFGIDSTCDYLLGLTSWNCGVNINDEDSLKTGIWTIAANVLTDITVIAAYLIIGYVIYGGYLYITSAGEAAKTVKGKKTLSQAFIGLAIVMSASIIMSGIRIALVGGSGNIGDCVSSGGCVTPDIMITNLIEWVIGIAGIVSVAFVVYGGIMYVTSAGDTGKLKKAKDMIVYALIGLVIVALAQAITAFVSNLIREANENAQVKETIISKEIYENKLN